ncbi:hypothetical protein ABZ769_36685 [Streptomyces olivoreticuli]
MTTPSLLRPPAPGLHRVKRRTRARISLPRPTAIRIKRKTSTHRLRGLAIAWSMLPQFAALIWCSLTGAAREAALLGILMYFSDYYLHRHEKPLLKMLGRIRLTLPLRVSAIGVCLVVLLVAELGLQSAPVRMTVACMLLWLAAQPLQSGQVQAILRLRRPPLVTRRVELPCYRTTARLAPPPAWLMRNEGRRLLHQLLVFLGGFTAWALTGDARAAAVGAGIALAWSLTTSVLLLPALLRALRLPRPRQIVRETEQWLRAYAPEVILYFSGDRSTAYQVNMWLPVLESIQARPLILVRERHLVTLLAPTTTPLLCVPDNDTIVNLDLPDSVKGALYPTNTGRNIHFHRRPEFRHVFIGHGDSDKTPSTNPVIRFYNEVWVAGRGHQERLTRAGLGIPEENIVHVGRPQLDAVAARDSLPAPQFALAEQRIPTVLYAPTWEGWADSPGATSLLEAGERIVRQLLYSRSPVRLLYRPHPYTGRRAPAARVAHQRIMNMIEKANHKRAKDPWYGGTTGGRPREDHTSLRKLRQDSEAVLEQLTGHGDELAQAARLSAPDRPALEAGRELSAEAEAAYWADRPWWEHRVVEPSDASLYSCFAQTDHLVSDISSVASDYIATLKPYSIVNTTGTDIHTFRKEHTAARAAYVLGPRGEGCERLVRRLYDADRHTLRQHQEELRTYLLGPAHPGAAQRFDQAVEALCGRGDRPRSGDLAERTNTDVAERTHTPEPGARGHVPQSHLPIGQFLGLGDALPSRPSAAAAQTPPRPEQSQALETLRPVVLADARRQGSQLPPSASSEPATETGAADRPVNVPPFTTEYPKSGAEAASSRDPSQVQLADLFADTFAPPEQAAQELPAPAGKRREDEEDALPTVTTFRTERAEI